MFADTGMIIHMHDYADVQIDEQLLIVDEFGNELVNVTTKYDDPFE